MDRSEQRYLEAEEQRARLQAERYGATPELTASFRRQPDYSIRTGSIADATATYLIEKRHAQATGSDSGETVDLDSMSDEEREAFWAQFGE